MGVTIFTGIIQNLRAVVFTTVVFDSLYNPSFCLSNIVILASFNRTLTIINDYAENLFCPLQEMWWMTSQFCSSFYIFDSNWCPCFLEYGTNTCIFCSVPWFLLSTASTSNGCENFWSMIWFTALRG